ncbi:hypothetical protein HDU97_009808, partial [Phlyctochytrium planicorne]
MNLDSEHASGVHANTTENPFCMVKDSSNTTRDDMELEGSASMPASSLNASPTRQNPFFRVPTSPPFSNATAAHSNASFNGNNISRPQAANSSSKLHPSNHQIPSPPDSRLHNSNNLEAQSADSSPQASSRQARIRQQEYDELRALIHAES